MTPRFLLPCLFLAPLAVQAEQLEMSYEAVMHTAEVQTIEILDDPAHHVGIAKFRGIALFEAEKPIVHRYEGWFDLVDGSGAFHGHALWDFGDGSEIRAAYEGHAEATSDGGVTVSAEIHDFSGTGRFEGATGEGSFAGERIDTLEAGGGTYITGVLNLTTP
ncbi:hypothetical protein [Pseudoruegeria sp. HB172150]|uniref:hypothetical protein n=1 Tax=Pseudoruegeria sp. HB172150 TaxID=2721164 RepID=UPI0015530BBC|nr:hypothetical protein [Pseudoruegeria sp. HB172150]